ncbi:MAG: hypothetical protein ABEL04_00970 [Salinibacter sp.]|uniref:hypothetical protein n=1 Tax=Salinibacter sp. TaxID=2065818 RepID=UPI0035D4C44B
MTITLEARWFGDAPPPRSLQDWIGQLDPETHETWTDFYLLSEDPGLNLKARDNKIQVKRRLAGPTACTFGPGVSGHYEQWVKWSFDRETEGAGPWSENSTGLWIPTRKTRHQRTFDAEAQSMLASALPIHPAVKVKMELTTFVVSEKEAWTLCLETEGPPEGLADTLSAAGEALLDADFPVPLAADQSLGYVRWLQRHPEVQPRPIPELLVTKPE